MATHSWKIPWTVKLGGPQSMGLQESDMTQQLNHHHCSCLTMLCQFLPYNELNQLHVYICPFPLGSPFHTPPPHPIPLVKAITEHWAGLPELPVLCSRFPLANLHGVVHICQSYLPIHPSFPFTHCVHMSSLIHLCLYSCPENKFISTIFVDSTYMH